MARTINALDSTRTQENNKYTEVYYNDWVIVSIRVRIKSINTVIIYVL